MLTRDEQTRKITKFTTHTIVKEGFRNLEFRDQK